MRYLLSIALLSVSIASQGGPHGLPKFPPNAYRLQDYTVPGSDTVQAAFRIKSQYPASMVVAHYTKGVSVEWARCLSRTQAWEAYIDKSEGQPRLVHQVIRYWVNHEQKKMLSIIVRHYSKGGDLRCEPDDNVQHAVVVVSRSPDLSKEISLLFLACGLQDTSVEIPPALLCQ